VGNPVNALTSGLGIIDTVADNIADPDNNSLNTRINRAVCDVYASNASASLAAGLGGAAVMEELCRKYWDSNGDEPPPVASPFNGGQCVTNYRVSATGATPSGESLTTSTGNQQVTGPIRSIELVLRPSGNANIFKVTTATNPFGVFSGSFGSNSLVEVVPSTVTFTVLRLDGQADNCGNPPSEIKPSPGYSRPRPIGAPTDIGVPGAPDPWTFSPSSGGGVSAEPAEGSPPFRYPDGFPGIKWESLLTGGSEEESGGAPPLAPTPPTEGEPEDLPEGEDSGEQGEPGKPDALSDDAYCIGYLWECDTFPDRQGRIVGTDTVFPFVWGNLQVRLKSDGDTSIYSDNLRLYCTQGFIGTPYSTIPVAGIRWQKNPSFSLRLISVWIDPVEQQQISEV